MNEETVIANALTGLNALRYEDDAKWYKVETNLSGPAKKDGRLRRIELWFLTPDAAREAGLNP